MVVYQFDMLACPLFSNLYNPEGAVFYSCKSKQPLVEMVQSMYNQEMSLNMIARVLNLNWRTLKKYSDSTYVSPVETRKTSLE